MKIGMNMQRFFCFCLLCISTSQTGCAVGNALVDNIYAGDFKEPPDSMWKKSAPENRAEMRRIINEAREGIPAGGVYDYHVHLVSNIKAETNYYLDSWCEKRMDRQSFINPKRFSMSNGLRIYLYTVGLESAGRIRDRDNASYQYAKRILDLVEHFNREIPEGGTFYLLALDGVYDTNGVMDEERTDLYVSNEFAVDITDCLNRKATKDGFGEPFVAVISINPNRKDWKGHLDDVVARIRNTPSLKDKPIFMKWLPNAMEFNPRLVPAEYFQALNDYGIAIIGHTGKEETVGSPDFHHYGSPELYSTALDNGVTVLMAHTGRTGENSVGDSGEPKANFDIFLDTMDKGYQGQLFGEMSALIINTTVGHLERLASNPSLKGRLVNGSDYPLPGMKKFDPLDELLERGWITKGEKDALHEFYQFNPFLFDFLVKRTVKWRDEEGRVMHAFPPEAFGSICDQPGTVSKICGGRGGER